MTTPVTQGPIERVPCPHCGKPNDFRGTRDEQMLETHAQVFCDHCDRSMIITAIRPVTLVAVRKDPSGKIAPPDTSPRPARTISAGVAQRLLGPGRGRR